MPFLLPARSSEREGGRERQRDRETERQRELRDRHPRGVEMETPARPPMTFEEAMEKAARENRGASGGRTTMEQRKAAGRPSLYHVEVYLQVLCL